MWVTMGLDPWSLTYGLLPGFLTLDPTPAQGVVAKQAEPKCAEDGGRKARKNSNTKRTKRTKKKEICV
jgi:hypothetical protein